MAFKNATKDKSKLRLALDGPSGAGKTYTALLLATAIAGPKGKVAVTDSERGSASKYADQFRFIVDDLESHHPEVYIKSIQDATAAGVDVQIIDSLSHAWMGKDGALEQVDKVAARSQSGNSFTAWREVTPMHHKLVDAILRAPHHIIVTMRSKTEYVMEQVERNGKTVTIPKKIGLAPVQRDGLEYEFDVVGDMDTKNRLVVGKTRCSALAGAVIDKPGAELAVVLMNWLNGPTAEDMLTWVKAEADNCFTLDDLRMLKESLRGKGGMYWGDAAKAIITDAVTRLKPAEVVAAPAEALAATPAASDNPDPSRFAEPPAVETDLLDDRADAVNSRDVHLQTAAKA